MKKSLRTAFALIGILLLTFCLCGCGLLDQVGKLLPELPFFQESGETEATMYVLPGPTDFYQEPNRNAPIIATYYAGHTVVYQSVVNVDGVMWAGANEGWFVLSDSQPDTPAYLETDEEGILTVATDTYAAASADAESLAPLSAGAIIRLSQRTADGTWGKTDYGWIRLDGYFRLDNLSEPVGYGVIRVTDACFYEKPSALAGVTGEPSSGSRHGLLAVLDIAGTGWVLTDAGWIPAQDIYEEGTVGIRACTAIVIDPTPLNVRRAPGTDQEILTTLLNGEQVEILEQVNYDGSDWGFTGTGWIFMDLTKIQ